MLNHLTSASSTTANLHWPEAVVAAVSIAIGGAIVIVAVWHGLAVWRTRVAAATVNDYRRLAEQSVAAQERTAVALTELAVDPKQADR